MALFRGWRECVEQTCDAWYVLSAKHGLVEPDRILEPYDLASNEAALALWRLLSDRRQLGPTCVSKLLAAKRPHLVPIFDSFVADALLPLPSIAATGNGGLLGGTCCWEPKETRSRRQSTRFVLRPMCRAPSSIA